MLGKQILRFCKVVSLTLVAEVELEHWLSESPGEVHFIVPCNATKQGPPATGTTTSCRWRCQQ